MSDDICENINVFCRLRPYSATEAEDKPCISLSSDGQCIYRNGDSKRDSSFKFSNCFSQTSTQEDLFDSCSKPIVDSVLGGYNGTILAYGPTNSGKTYTMRGETFTALGAKMGIIPR